MHSQTDMPRSEGRTDGRTAIREVVIVDPACDSYGEFVAAAQGGGLGLHFCVDGRSAMRLARRFRADIWLVAIDLPDMSGFDLVAAMADQVGQGDVDPLRSGARISLDRIGDITPSGLFLVANAYHLEEELRALSSGVAGYLVRPVSLDLVRGDLFLGDPASGERLGAFNNPQFGAPCSGVSFTEGSGS
jgi:CheY-like chemotaxis protein